MEPETKRNKMQALFESRRFWIAVGAAIVSFAKQFNVELDQDTINNIVTLAGAWILGDTFRRTE